MPHTTFKDLEQQYGDLHQVIPAMLRRTGSQELTARALGISDSALSRWLIRNGYARKSVWVREGGQS